MGDRLSDILYQSGKRFWHYCPACDELHAYDERWTFNGEHKKPTFSPSMKVEYKYGEEQIENRCHYFIIDGLIIYCSDSTHPMRGKTIELPAIPETYNLEYY